MRASGVNPTLTGAQTGTQEESNPRKAHREPFSLVPARVYDI
jgi:hypothetical protein